MAELPVAIKAEGGTCWAIPQGPHPHAGMLELLDSDVDVPAGFRITRGEHHAVEPTERRIAVDQTNDSWVVGEAVVVKWTTQPLVGPHPGPERLRRLTAAGFTSMPRLWGLLEWQTPDGFWVPLVTAVDLIRGAVDGWTWCLAEARRALGLEAGSTTPFAPRLGRLTAEMHLALADSTTGPVADHGDFHVGQILRPPSGELYVVDFDGNPTLKPTERVAHRPAAYDVAGMLLSLENVGHVVRHYAPEVTDAHVAAWTRQAQTDFLDAYRESAPGLLDQDLLEPYVLDQIHRELAYADAHLPRWRYVPEAALRRRGL